MCCVNVVNVRERFPILVQNVGANPLVLCPSLDWLPRLLFAAHYAFHVANMALADPEGQVSAGVHQTVGPCDVTALDLAGQERQVYLCAQNFQEVRIPSSGENIHTPFSS